MLQDVQNFLLFTKLCVVLWAPPSFHCMPIHLRRPKHGNGGPHLIKPQLRKKGTSRLPSWQINGTWKITAKYGISGKKSRKSHLAKTKAFFFLLPTFNTSLIYSIFYSQHKFG